METPLQTRFPARTKKRLAKASAKTGIKQADLVRLAADELLKKYPTDDALFSAVMAWKREEASK